MAAAKAAIQTSRDSLHDQQQPNAPFYSGFIISSFLKMSSTRQARPVTCSRKEELIPPSLSRPTPTLLSFCGFMRWSSWKREAWVVLQNLAGSLVKKSGKSYSETSNCMKSRMSIHTSMHLRITHPHEPNQPTSPVGRWSRPQPVLALDEQQTYLKIEQKSHVENSELTEEDKSKNPLRSE